jgi:hypothetical protein
MHSPDTVSTGKILLQAAKLCKEFKTIHWPPIKACSSDQPSNDLFSSSHMYSADNSFLKCIQKLTFDFPSPQYTSCFDAKLRWGTQWCYHTLALRCQKVPNASQGLFDGKSGGCEAANSRAGNPGTEDF